jgi:hypothetical protein
MVALVEVEYHFHTHISNALKQDKTFASPQAMSEASYNFESVAESSPTSRLRN